MFFWFKYIYPIIFRIGILFKRYCRKTVFHLKGYTTVVYYTAQLESYNWNRTDSWYFTPAVL